MLFSDRVSVVTGASQGIGEAIALHLAEEGAEIILVDIQEDKLEQLAQRIKDRKGKAHPLAADVSRMEEAAKAAEKVLTDHHKIDHLVNNAGITRDNLFLRMKEEEWDAVLAVNLKGVFNFCKAVIRAMISRRYGRIINLSSVVGLMGNVGQTNYSASKAGVVGFTKSLAREVASRGITVNAVAPGYVDTAMTQKLPDSAKKAFLELIPMRRFAAPEEVAHLVKFLLSDEAAYITGQVININGGLLM
ncbi:MAG: 3-oxoacyl-[acyl-carrier-protein] reductase [Candidatus Aminicenantes bacterium]